MKTSIFINFICVCAFFIFFNQFDKKVYGLLYVANNSIPVPLQNVSAEANIVDMIAQVTVCQTYKNVENDTIEAIYKFPLHEAAAIHGFEAEIDGNRKVKGIVKEAEQAAKGYDEAVQQGHGAYLFEEELPDIFQCSIGNIEAGQTVVIRITYVTELKHDAETENVRFVFPTAIAPRYGSSNDFYDNFLDFFVNHEKNLVPDVMSYSTKVVYYLALSITCRMSSVIQSVESPSHHISVELNIDGNPKVSRITLADQITYLENDFILVIKSLGLDQPRAFIEYNPKTETNCIMLTLVPNFATNVIMTELIFVIDRSGSMEGGSIKKASDALQVLLRSLPKDCFFNVISFGSNFDSLFEKSQPYSEESFSKALKYAQEMTANYGGTEIYKPFKWAFENSRNDMPTSMFLLTDGRVYNVDQIIELIKSYEEKKMDDLRFFSIGIGVSVSHHLVESVSRVGKGYAQFITDTERMDKKIIRMLKNAIKPPIKDYKITWTNQTFSSFNENTTSPTDQNIITDIKIQQAPFLIPPIYSGVRFIVYCILEKGIEVNKEIIVSAMSNDGPIKLSIPLDPVRLQGSKIHTLAARKLIQDLDDGTSFIHRHQRNNGKNISASFIREQIVKLGTVYNLASKHTSFLAIDERDNKSVSDPRRFRIVPTRNRMLTGNFEKLISGSLHSFSLDKIAFSHSFIRYELGEPELSTSNQFVSHNATEMASLVKLKSLNIETLYDFLDLQSYDGSFLPTIKFYSWFGKNDFNDFSIIGIENENVLCSALAIAYLEIIMFETFKEECELCYDKAKKFLMNEVDNEQNFIEILEKAKEWVIKWANE
ncbi:von willebrand domain-containing protein [Gigaspora margarita]|uniref:von willebrand domain-containing protein n=1 Tax=Gigaspora margarita TaxID=4874 RepID=A0A8H4EJF9_GIGMA|nr:von willebrand domain-containing protein [Gigaspora margarita]